VPLLSGLGLPCVGTSSAAHLPRYRVGHCRLPPW